MAERSGSSEVVGTSKHAPKKGMVLPFQPLSVAFNHINYYVDMPAVSHSFTPYEFLELRILTTEL